MEKLAFIAPIGKNDGKWKYQEEEEEEEELFIISTSSCNSLTICETEKKKIGSEGGSWRSKRGQKTVNHMGVRKKYLLSYNKQHT